VWKRQGPQRKRKAAALSYAEVRNPGALKLVGKGMPASLRWGLENHKGGRTLISRATKLFGDAGRESGRLRKEGGGQWREGRTNRREKIMEESWSANGWRKWMLGRGRASFSFKPAPGKRE